MHSPWVNHWEKPPSRKAQVKEGHKVDCERSDNNALVISPIQRLKKRHYRPPHMYRRKELKQEGQILHNLKHLASENVGSKEIYSPKSQFEPR